MDLEKDIAISLKFLNDDEFLPEFEIEQYSSIFPRTNEALYLYYPHFKLQDASVLTVTGSGDHVLQAIRMGSWDITTFDKNKLVYYYLYLKLGGVEALSFDEFCVFFGYGAIALQKDMCFNEATYKKIRPYLAKDVLTYWDKLYQEGNFACNYNNLLYSDGRTSNLGRRSYLVKNSYPLLKDKLKDVKINFLAIDLLDLPKVLVKDKKYDTIFLSNIFDWLVKNEDIFNYDTGNPHNFENFVKSELTPFLKEGGKCALYTPLSAFKTEAEKYLESPYFNCGERNRVPKRVYVYTKK